MRIKIFIIAVVACLVLSMSGLAYAAVLTDIEGNWAKAQIEKMVTSGAVNGYPDGSFKPEAKVSRAEFTTMVNRAFGKVDQNAKVNFADVKETDWHYVQVASGKAAGYIAGYTDNTFKPDNAISREEAAVILTKLLGLDANKTEAADVYTDVQNIAPWAKGSVAAVTTGKVMNGYPAGSFKPQTMITRAEAVVAIVYALEVKNNTTTTTSTDSGGGSSQPSSVISEAVGYKAEFLGTYLYSVQGKVTSAVYSVEVTIGTEKFVATPVNGEFLIEKAVEGNINSAVIKAKSAVGSVIGEVSVTFTSNNNDTAPVPVITNAAGLKAEFLGTYMYSVTGNVSSTVKSVEVTIGTEKFIVSPVNGEFKVEKAVEGNINSAVIIAKSAVGAVIGEVSVTFTSNNNDTAPAAEIVNAAGLKAEFLGTYMYSVTGNVSSTVATVEVTIGTEKFIASPVNGEFKVEKAVEGNFNTATIKAKNADGVVTDETIVTFVMDDSPEEALNNVRLVSKTPFGNSGAYMYVLTGEVSSNITSVEVSIGDKLRSIAPANGEFTIGIFSGDLNEAVVKAKAVDGTVIQEQTIRF